MISLFRQIISRETVALKQTTGYLEEYDAAGDVHPRAAGQDRV